MCGSAAVRFDTLVLRAGGTKLMDTLSGSKTPSILGEAVRSAKGLNAPGRGLAKVKVPVDKKFLLQTGMHKWRPPRTLPVPGLKTVPMTMPPERGSDVPPVSPPPHASHVPATSVSVMRRRIE